MKTRIWLGRLAAVLCVGAVWQASPNLIAQAQAPHQAAAAPEVNPLQIAVVDLPSLIKQHPDYEQLKQLDETMDVQQKKVELIPHESIDRARKKAGQRMQAELEKARLEMKAAETKIRADLEGLGESYSSQFKSQMEALQAQAKRDLTAEIEKYKGEHAPHAAPPSGSGPPDIGNRDLAEYRKNLVLMRTRLLLAHRLELERAEGSDLQAERTKLDHELGVYEDQVGSKYQADKINYQLKMQVASTEAEQKEIQDKLGKISDQIATAKAQKRTEIDSEFSRFQAKRKAEAEADLRSYQTRVDDDVIRKLGGPPRHSAHVVATRPTGQSKGPPAEIENKIKELLQANIRSQMEAKSAELKSRMQNEQQQARARLEAKHKEIEARLHKIQSDLMATVTEEETDLDAATKARLEQAKASLKKTKGERDALLKKILADIRGAVAKVAEKKHVPMVIGDVVFQGAQIVDLTDLSMVAIKEMGSSK